MTMSSSTTTKTDKEPSSECKTCIQRLLSVLEYHDKNESSSSSSSYTNSSTRTSSSSPLLMLLEAIGTPKSQIVDSIQALKQDSNLTNITFQIPVPLPVSVAANVEYNPVGGQVEGYLDDDTMKNNVKHKNTAGFGGHPFPVHDYTTNDKYSTMSSQAMNTDIGVLKRLKSRFTKNHDNNSTHNHSDSDNNGVNVSSSSYIPVATSAHHQEDSSTNSKSIHINPTTNTNTTTTLTISCQPCGITGPESGARAYTKGPNPLSIVLCSNRLYSTHDIHQVLIHELIHVYDVHIRSWDLTNCHTLAKSEVRAAREAECKESIFPKFCIQDKATIATRNMFPNDGMGKQCVQTVLQEAMADFAPFKPTSLSTLATSKNNSNVNNNNSNSSSSSSSQHHNSTTRIRQCPVDGRTVQSSYSQNFHSSFPSSS